MFFEMKEEIRNKITTDDVVDVLLALGSDYPKVNEEYLVFQTVCHHYPKDNMSYKLYYYLESGIFKCYTGRQGAYDIYGLVQDTLKYRGIDISLEGAIEYVVNHSAVSVGFTIGGVNKSDPHYSWDFIDEYKSAMNKGKKSIQSLKPYSSHVLDIYKNFYYEGWLEENISFKAMKKFNIKYSILDNRIVIPHYDIYGNLIGIRGRALREEEIESGYKYMPMTIQNKLYSHPTSMNLYGIYRNKSTIRKQRQCVIFESEKSVLKAESIYPDENYTLALAGKSFSDQQIKILLHLNVNRVILALDKDYIDFYSERGQECYNNMLKVANELKPYFSVYLMVDDKDLLKEKNSPIDQGKEIFEKLYKRKIRL